MAISAVARRLMVVVAATSMFAPFSCSVVTPSSDLTGGETAAADAADAPAADASTTVDGGGADTGTGSPDAPATTPDTGPDVDAGDGSAPRCPSGVGPAMVEVTTLLGASYCVDSTEVTQGQYGAFLIAKGSDVSGQGPLCDFNDSYIPLDCGAGPFDPSGKAAMPVNCVDWCDARAFCAWNGKRLCGKIGGTTVAPNAVNDAQQSQWYAACSHNGANAYPYGASYDAGACNGADTDAGAAWAAGSHPTCQGGTSGIFDMSGNLGEWEDACAEVDAGAGLASCPYRGGTFHATGASPSLRCDNGGGYQFGERRVRSAEIGFRCCAD